MEKEIESDGETMKGKIVQNADFSEGFDETKIRMASETEILPSLSLKQMLEKSGDYIDVTFASEPYKVESEKLPNKTAWFISVFFGNQKYSMVIPNSLRFSLLALSLKHKWRKYEGKKVRISLHEGQIQTPIYKGKARTYSASLIPESETYISENEQESNA